MPRASSRLAFCHSPGDENAGIRIHDGYVHAVMPGGESPAHLELKRLALQWAQMHGFEIAAPEVRLPRSNYRADVAACAPRHQKRTAIFECKQARADLLKDARLETEARLRVGELTERLRHLESLIAVHRPDLRCGESLFPEFDAWNLLGLEHETHRRVVAELAAWQGRLQHGTKFAKLLRWCCADFLYLVTEDGIFAEAEIPAGWGLLLRRESGLELVRRPLANQASAESRLALLERVAVAATRCVNRQAGVTFPLPTGFEAMEESARE